MRRLTKAAEPEVLASRSAAWTSAFAQALASGAPPPSPWQNAAIVAALRSETHDKCAYCEAVISDVAYPNVEHIYPKVARPDLVVTWTNLTLACPHCNTVKGAYYDEAAPLVNPYEDEPGEHIVFAGPTVFAPLGDLKGERTIVKLELRRAALVAERMKRLQALHDLLERWHASMGSERELREELIRIALGDDQEFVCCLRAHAEQFGFPYSG